MYGIAAVSLPEAWTNGTIVSTNTLPLTTVPTVAREGTLIVSGMGNPAGALVASFVVSIAESLSVMVIPSQWQNLIAFAVMIVMLLIRPRGLFGRAVSR